MVNKAREVCNKLHLPTHEVADLIGVTPSSYRKWCMDENRPSYRAPGDSCEILLDLLLAEELTPDQLRRVRIRRRMVSVAK